MILRPINDQIIVELEAAGKFTPGGVAIPDAFNRSEAVRTEKARVLAVGPGRITKQGILCRPQVNEGDKVIIYRSMGTEMKNGDKRLVIIQEKDILAVSDD